MGIQRQANSPEDIVAYQVSQVSNQSLGHRKWGCVSHMLMHKVTLK